MLSRRWHRVHVSVPVVALADGKRGRRLRTREITRACFDHQLTSALLGRDPAAKGRALRLDVYSPTLSILDQCVAVTLYAGRRGGGRQAAVLRGAQPRQALPVRPVRGVLGGVQVRPEGQDAHSFLQVHHAARCLRLTNWTLDLPGDVSLPLLDTLFLNKIAASSGALQLLISGCPRLAHTTLEEYPGATEMMVPSTR